MFLAHVLLLEHLILFLLSHQISVHSQAKYTFYMFFCLINAQKYLLFKVATYRIFCRAADRPNAKARMADTNYPGSGQQVSFILRQCIHHTNLYVVI